MDENTNYQYIYYWLISNITGKQIWKYLSYYGFIEFNGSDFARIHGFPRHFPKYGNIHLLYGKKEATGRLVYAQYFVGL